MPDIIVTTPKNRMAEAAREAEEVKAAGGGYYYRDYRNYRCPKIGKGERVYYVEDGYIRGFCLVHEIIRSRYERGYERVVMDAATWVWIEPIPMKGFQGFRYAEKAGIRRDIVREVGNWSIPKPKICPACGAIYWMKCPNACG
jgi:hypothetical protein